MIAQAKLHRRDRAKYSLVHPTLGTINKARADEIWDRRGAENCVTDVMTQDEKQIVRYLWDQLDGSSSFMTAFFIFYNQEVD